MAGPIATFVPGQRCCTASASTCAVEWPEHRQRLVVADAQDAQVRAVGQRQTQIAQLAVDLDGRRRVGQARPDRARGVEAARAVGEDELVAVGEDGGGHASECRYPGKIAC